MLPFCTLYHYSKIILYTVLLCCSSQLLNAQDWVQFYPQLIGNHLQAHANGQHSTAEDLGNNVIGFRHHDATGAVVRTDTVGSSSLYATFYDEVDSSYLMASFYDMEKRTQENALAWTHSCSTAYNAGLGPGRCGLHTAARISSRGYVYLNHDNISAQLDFSGNLIRIDTAATNFVHNLVVSPDEHTIVTIDTAGLMAIDTNGTDLWQIPISNFYAKVAATDWGTYMAVCQLFSGDMVFLEIDQTGTILTSNQVPMLQLNNILGVVPTRDSGLVFCAGHFGNNWTRSIQFIKLNKQGNVIAQKVYDATYNGQELADGYKMVSPSEGRYVVLGRAFQNGAPSGNFVLQESNFPSCDTCWIAGRVVQDSSLDCVADSIELGLPATVEIQGAFGNSYVNTDSNGYYYYLADTGFNSVIVHPNGSYWQPCQDTQVVYTSAAQPTATVDFAAQAIANCPLLTVEVAAPFLRRCFPNTIVVSYENKGTLPANNTSIEVRLDSHLVYNSSSITPASQTGQLYHFNIGTLGVGQSGQFTINATVNCQTALLGQTHCIEAQAYPDTICLPQWSVQDSCGLDSVYYFLTNHYTSAQSGFYALLVDSTIVDTGSITLGAGQVLQLSNATSLVGTYALSFEPANGDAAITHLTLACQTGNPFLSISNWLAPAYSTPAHAIFCEPNRGSYDPNDKTGYPLGYGQDHQILPNTPLKYRIRFQNTGTDTAFTVVIRDQLPTELQASTLQMGASSHSYTWSIDKDGLLEVRFDNILLPDSNTNEPLSHGFIYFQIQQQPNLPLLTTIENSAGIYFDFNPPIITNTTLHTVNINYLPNDGFVSTTTLEPTATLYHIYPNPSQGQLWIQQSKLQETTVELYTLSGQLLQQSRLTTVQGQLSLQGLAQGVYLLRLTSQGQVTTKKIVLY